MKKKFKTIDLKTMNSLKGGRISQRQISTASTTHNIVAAFQSSIDVELEVTTEVETEND